MDKTQPTPEAAVRNARIIWWAMLAGQVIFLIVVLAVMGKTEPVANRDIPKLLALLSGILLISGIPIGLMLRKKLWDSGRIDGKLQPSSYVAGHVLFLAVCEGPSLLALVSVLIAGTVFPFVLPALVAMAVQAAHYPTEAALQP